MVTGKDSALGPVTLRQAHELLTPQWPGVDAPIAAQVAYHDRAVRLYQHVARVDPDHHHEALYWAGYERNQVEQLRASIGAPQDKKGDSA